MALSAGNERKSLRRVMRNEADAQVLAIALSYEAREIVLQIERINQPYCDAHPDEVQQAVNNFLHDGNAALAAEGLPRIE